MYSDLVAAVPDAVKNIKTELINPALKLLVALSVIYFLWGVLQFMLHREDEDKKKHLLWGVIGVAITISAFGIVNLIVNFVSSVK
ncbi:MAG: hypothetical protein AAB590_02325 [Patescibacteria group bacterium]